MDRKLITVLIALLLAVSLTVGPAAAEHTDPDYDAEESQDDAGVAAHLPDAGLGDHLLVKAQIGADVYYVLLNAEYPAYDGVWMETNDHAELQTETVLVGSELLDPDTQCVTYTDSPEEMLEAEPLGGCSPSQASPAGGSLSLLV